MLKQQLIALALLLCSFQGFAQTTTITGKVIDSETGEGMPFVNVYFNTNTAIGTTTDFEGQYSISTTNPSDSLIASYLGYLPKAKLVKKGETQVINFQLVAESTTLKEIEIVYGEYENPAWKIMRNVVKNKKNNDLRKLSAYQFESYSKIEVDVDNISEKFRQKKVIQKIIHVLDSIQQIAGEDGKPILPVFISESLSEYYHINNPSRDRENILKTKLTGIGLDDGSLVSQLIGSSFQQYNFYQNWLKISSKDFISPIADSWKAFYEYELVNEEKLEDIKGFKCHRINFKPKRPEDLAFTGTMWITDSTFALKQIDLRIGKEANLNFIEKVQVQQELEPADTTGAWLPSKSRILIDVGEIRDDWAGMLAKFYVSNKNFVVNQPKPDKFYEERVVVDEEAMRSDDQYWQTHRHDTLTGSEQNIYAMIDTMRNLPVVKTYVELADIAFNGYKKVGKFEIGPYIYLYNNNNVEGHRVQLGVRTNPDFSKKFIFKVYGAYGTKDQRFKYNGEVEYILSRKPWAKLGVGHYYDIDQVGIFNDNLGNNTLFNASSRFGTLRRPFNHRISKFWFQSDIMRGWTQRVMLRTRHFDPINEGYEFFYSSLTDDTPQDNFRVTELIFETRIAFKEKFIQYDNTRVSLGTKGRPIITLRGTFGLSNFLGSDFSYQKYDGSLEHNVRIGLLGRLDYRISGGYVPSKVPYPLLETHLGNESIFFNNNSYNLMNFFEYVSDTYVSLRLKHGFDGLLLNRIPLMRKLKWRSFVTGNFLYGSVRQENIDIIPNQHTPIPAFEALGDEPYVEVGYGVENILRFIRVDFLHRLTYQEKEGVNRFGVKVSVEFRL
ncbi:MAG: DUF5686 family protein [Flammeovirgaceae bacterium]